jgi:hypothetical protein
MVEARRSLARIEEGDLLRPEGAGRYAGRLLCRALCQGAALHYLDGENGVKDLDVWSFYAARSDGPFPYRWRGIADYGPSRFGRYPGDPSALVGRRVDLFGRSLPAPPGADPAAVIRAYLSAARTKSAKALAAKAVILIAPERCVGEVLWPVGRQRVTVMSSPAGAAPVRRAFAG